MRVLVTGAQGCIGAWCVKKLLDRGAEVVALDLDDKPVRLSLIAGDDEIRRVRFLTGRIEDSARIKAIVRDEEITHVVHLAAVLMPFCQTQPIACGLINVIGTLNVFEAARDSGRDVRIAYASSSAVWGPGEVYEDRPLSEDDMPRPATHYGVFKQANEGNARVFYSANGISSIGLRPWTVYGAGRDQGLTSDPTFAIKAAAKGEPYTIRLSGFMDFQYVEDVAATFLQCLFSGVTGAHVFNLAGEVRNISEFVENIEYLRPAAKGLIKVEGPQVPVAYRMSDARIRETVGPVSKTELREGIGRTLEIFERLSREGRI